MRKEGILLLLVLVCFMPVVSAEILISQPSGIYNLGDKFNVSITLIPKSTVTDFFTTSVICGSSSIEVYRSALGTTYGTNKVIPLDIFFDRVIIGNVRGNCYIKAEYGPENAISQSFEITDSVRVSFEIDSALIDPGKSVSLTGKAIKANGNPLEGVVEAIIEGTDVSSSQIVNDGKFSLVLSIPENMAAGNYFINVIAYEKKNDRITNSGNASSAAMVKAVANWADIALSNAVINPGEELAYSVILYDQNNQLISGEELSITLYNPKQESILKKLGKSGRSEILSITNTFVPGNWVLEAKINNLETRKNFVVNELEKASFVIENNTLIITNTGNVPYTKPVEVKIGEKSDVKDISLGVNEVKEFRLLAPDGNYDINVIEGNSTYSLGTTFLTGNAIAVKDVQDFFMSNKYSAGIWIGVIIILVFIAVKYYRKRKESKSYFSVNYSEERYIEKQKPEEKQEKEPISLVKSFSDTSRNRIERRQFLSRENEKPKQEENRKISLYNPPALVMRKIGSGIEHGEREEAALVALKIRNIQEIEDSDTNAKESVAKIFRIFDESGAKILRDRSSVLAIFSSAKFADQVYSRATDVAKQIESVLLVHNRRYVHKVAFGIGLHSGELITEHLGEDFKYASVGNAIPSVKRLAERAQSEIAVSENAVSKVRSFVKLQRVQNDNYWKVLGSIEKRDGKYNEFINQFMKRQKGGW